MERQSHNNPWADRLQEVSIPEAGDSWQAMESLLNKELPVPRRVNWGHWGRWIGFPFSAVALTVAVYFIWFGRHQSTQSLSAAASAGRPAVAPSPARPGGSSGAFPSSSQDSSGSQGSSGIQGSSGHQGSSGSSGIQGSSASSDSPGSRGSSASSDSGSVSPAASSSAGAASTGAGAASSSASTGHLPARLHSSSENAGSAKIAGANASIAKPGHPPAAASSGSAHSISVYSGSTLSGSALSRSALSLRPTRHPSLHQKTHDLTVTRNQDATATGHRHPADTRNGDTHTTPATAAAGATPGDASRAMRGASPLAATGNAPRVPSSAIPEQHSLHHSYPGKIRPLDVPPPGAIGGRMILPNWKNDQVLVKAKAANRSRSNSPLSISRTGWQLAIGFNQPVVLGGQGAWNKRAGGVNPALLDYIPVPSISYYFQPKLYIQVEARFHAPQYTQRNLGFQYTNFDTTSTALPTGTVFIEKLFYFQLPVSIHFSPLPNWSVGLGLEYSRYSNGIAYNNFFPGAKPTSLKRYPSLFIQQDEFRGMVSLNYTFRRWVVGITYDQAFNRFMHTQLSGPTIFNSQTLARNSALQLTLRYTLWDSRKRRSPAK